MKLIVIDVQKGITDQRLYDYEGFIEKAQRLINAARENGVEVIYDDRDVRPGFMFADADLLGVPVRCVVGPKGLANGEIELATRDKSVQKQVKKEDIIAEIKNLIASLREDIYKNVK